MRPLAAMAASAEGHLTERLRVRGDQSETDQWAGGVSRAFDAQARAEAAIRSPAAGTSHELRVVNHGVSPDDVREGLRRGLRVDQGARYAVSPVARRWYVSCSAGR